MAQLQSPDRASDSEKEQQKTLQDQSEWHSNIINDLMEEVGLTVDEQVNQELLQTWEAMIPSKLMSALLEQQITKKTALKIIGAIYKILASKNTESKTDRAWAKEFFRDCPANLKGLKLDKMFPLDRLRDPRSRGKHVQHNQDFHSDRDGDGY